MKNKILQITFFLFIAHFCYAQDKHTWTENQKELDEQTENIVFEIKKRNTKKSDTEQEKLKMKKDFFRDGRTSYAFGIKASAMAANPYFKINDFLRPVLEVDLNKISTAIPKQGFGVAVTVNAGAYLDIYIKQKYEFGFFSNINSFALMTLPKDILNFAANGNPDGKGLQGKLTGTAYSFADTGLFYGITIKSFKFRISASYYLPAFYLEPEIGTYKFVTDPATGKLLTKGNLNLKLYTSLNLKDKKNIRTDLLQSLKNGGADISFDGTYKLTPYADFNFSFLHIPLYPAYMDKGYSINHQGYYSIKSVLDYLNALLEKRPLSEVDPPDGKLHLSGPNFNLPRKAVFRPLKFKFGIDIYPFGNRYLIISPKIGFHFFKPFYIDAGFRIESRFLKVFGVYYSFDREDRIWKNTGGLFMDLRLFRAESFISSSATSFTSSFKGTGLEAGIKLVFGY